MPRTFRFSGALQDGAGQAAAGVQGVTFALYGEQQGGAPLWLETQNVTADAAGNYTVLLGSQRADGLPLDLFTSNEAKWLGVRVNQPDAVEQPRVLLVSVPYALKAADAETLGGKPISAFLLASSGDLTSDKDGPPQASASDDPPTAAAGTSGAIGKFDVDNTTLVNSVMTESSGKIGLANSTPVVDLDVAGTIRAVLAANAPFGTYLMPTGGAANSFRFGFGNNLFFDGANWRTKGDGVNNAGSGILTDIGLGHLQVFALPPTGGTDQVVSNAAFNGFERLRVRGSGQPTLEIFGTIGTSLSPTAPYGSYMLPTGGAANSFRFGFGNNLFFDGANWRTKGDGGNNAGSAILTDIGLGHLQIITLPSTGGADQVVANGSLTSFEKLRIAANGNVGIGTTNPTAKLDVAGSLKVVDGTQAAGKVLTSDASGLASWQTLSGVVGGSGTTNFLPKFTAASTVGNSQVFDNGTNVGVGTSTPGTKLEVAGNVKANAVVFPDASTQTTAAPANSKIRGINFIAGCDTCSLLLDTDDQQDFYINVIGSMTINSVKCFSDAGTPSMQVLRDDGSPANLLSANLVCTTGGALGTLVGGESTLNLDDKLDFSVIAAGGVAKRITLVIKATVQ